MKALDVYRYYKKKYPLVKEGVDWFKHISMGLVMGLFMTKVVMAHSTIPTHSMEPTLIPGEHLISNRLAYSFSEIERGDVVIFKYPDNEEQIYVKRVIGLPGETLFITNGDIYVDGEVMNDEYGREPIEGDFGPYNVPNDYYFMLGDNRNQSLDSREWNNTYVHEDKILGKGIFKFGEGVEFFNKNR